MKPCTEQNSVTTNEAINDDYDKEEAQTLMQCFRHHFKQSLALYLFKEFRNCQFFISQTSPGRFDRDIQAFVRNNFTNEETRKSVTHQLQERYQRLFASSKATKEVQKAIKEVQEASNRLKGEAWPKSESHHYKITTIKEYIEDKEWKKNNSDISKMLEVLEKFVEDGHFMANPLDWRFKEELNILC